MSWKHPFNQYEAAVTIALIVQCIALIHNAVLLIYHTCSIQSTKNNAHLHQKTNKRIHQLTFVTMLLLSIQRIPHILTVLDMKPSSLSCEHWFCFQTVSFFFTKTAVNILFIERLYAIFHKSMFQFSTYAINLTRIYLIVYLIFASLLACIFNEHYNDNDHCFSSHPIWVVGIILVCDFCTGIFLSIVFTRKLLWFSTFALDALGIKQQESLSSCSNSELNKDPNEYNDMNEVMNLVKKVTLLALITIFTTLSVFVFIAFFELHSIWTSIDTMINEWCILLMYTVHGKLYMFLCKKVESAVISIKCLQCYSCRCLCCRCDEEQENEAQCSDLQPSDAKTDCVVETEAETNIQPVRL